MSRASSTTATLTAEAILDFSLPFIATGLSHHLAPLPVREQLHLDESQVVDALRALVGHAGLRGAVCLSTCNRTEFYLSTADERQSEQTVSRFFHYFDLQPGFQEMVYSHVGSDGLRHLFRVASGLDSMVLGEAQILAQFKRAHRLAAQAGTLDAELDLIMRRAVEAAKLVRTSTGISREAVGFANAAVEVAGERLASLADVGVVILGAGSIGGATAKLLSSRGARLLVVRRGAKAESLAGALGAELVEFAELSRRAAEFRVLICSTSSEERVLDVDAVAAIRRNQGPEPLLIIDLAVPRDVQPEAAALSGVELRDLDHLGAVVQRNVRSRERHRPAADAVVEKAVVAAAAEIAGRSAAPLIAALVDRAETVRQGELSRALSRMDPLSAREREQLERLTQAIAAKLLHQPISFMRQHAEDPQRRRLVQEVFGLDPEEGLD